MRSDKNLSAKSCWYLLTPWVRILRDRLSSSALKGRVDGKSRVLDTRGRFFSLTGVFGRFSICFPRIFPPLSLNFFRPISSVFLTIRAGDFFFYGDPEILVTKFKYRKEEKNLNTCCPNKKRGKEREQKQAIRSRRRALMVLQVALLCRCVSILNKQDSLLSSSLRILVCSLLSEFQDNCSCISC